MPECGRYHKPVRICLSPEALARLDDAKKRYGFSRSYIIDRLVKEYLDELLARLVERAGSEGGASE
jgi:predicted DNA-binding protein